MAFLDFLGPIGTAVGGILNPVLSFLGVRDTNRTNVAMNQATNEQNYQIAQDTNNFNRQEREAAQNWNFQTWKQQQDLLNSYNSPQAQAQRLKAAGLNPYSLMSEGNAQSVGSVQTSPAQGTTGAPMVAPQVSNEVPPNAFSDIVDKVLASLNAVEDIKGKHTDNEVKIASAQNEIDKRRWEAVEAMQRARKGSKEYDIAHQQLRQAMAQTAMLELQAKRANLLAEQSDQAFAASMQSLRDQHDESVIRQATQRFQNILAFRLDDRQQKELALAFQRARQEIDESKSRASLNRANTYSIRSKLRYEVSNIIADTNLKKQQRNIGSLEEHRNLNQLGTRENSKVFRALDDVVDWFMSSSLGQLKL